MRPSFIAPELHCARASLFVIVLLAYATVGGMGGVKFFQRSGGLAPLCPSMLLLLFYNRPHLVP